MAAAAILNLLPSRFLAYRRCKSGSLGYVPLKFYKSITTSDELSSVNNSRWQLSAILNYCVAMRSLVGDRKPMFKFRLDRVCSFIESLVNLAENPRSQKNLRFGGLTNKIIFHNRDPRRHYLGGKHVLWAIVRRNRSSGMARTRCEGYTNKKTNKG